MSKEKVIHEPLFHISKRTDENLRHTAFVKAIAILSGFIFCGLLSWICIGANPISVYASMIKGVFVTGDVLDTLRTASILWQRDRFC